jgi:hypothetical protein
MLVRTSLEPTCFPLGPVGRALQRLFCHPYFLQQPATRRCDLATENPTGWHLVEQVCVGDHLGRITPARDR